MVSVWEETDTVKGKWNILPKMASYRVRSSQWQICSEPSQISHFLNVFLGVFVVIGNTTAEAVHWFSGFVNSKWFWWLGTEVSVYPAFSICFLPGQICCASVNRHRFSREWNVITAAGCVHQVHWRTGSLGFCVISGASNVLQNAFFSRRWHWLSELAASSALNAVPPGSRTTSSVFILTQLRCEEWAWYKPFL